MDSHDWPDNPYVLLTPGPLSTTATVKAVMLQDWCTWDDDYHQIVESIRSRLVSLATRTSGYSTVLMQGSGTFSVESVVTTAVGAKGKLLVLANGVYGRRMGIIANRCGVPVQVRDSGEVQPPDITALRQVLAQDPDITHVAVVHCETTTGMLNPVEEIGKVVKEAGKIFIVDAMSSFGGIPMDVCDMGADYLISSANKCIQGVPGFGFVIARDDVLEQTRGQARSLSLDLYDQWQTMKLHSGKWRFTSPTHVVRAFAQALDELDAEGGVAARFRRYRENHQTLTLGMKALGFQSLLPDRWQSPIITAFYSPEHPQYRFREFYDRLKAGGFVIYPGSITDLDTFRIGTIGDIRPETVTRLLAAVQEAMIWKPPS